MLRKLGDCLHRLRATGSKPAVVGSRQRQVDAFGNRGITETGVGAALIDHVEGDAPRSVATTFDGQAGEHVVVVNLHLAEVLVVLDRADGQHRRAEYEIAVTRGGESEAFTIQVVAIGDLPLDGDGIGIWRLGEHIESYVRIEKLDVATSADVFGQRFEYIQGTERRSATALGRDGG